MKKRIVSFLMALVMAVSLLPVQVFAASSPTGGNGPNNLAVPDEYEIVASYPAGYTEYISYDTYVVRVPLGTPSIKGITTNFEIASTECFDHDLTLTLMVLTMKLLIVMILSSTPLA